MKLVASSPRVGLEWRLKSYLSWLVLGCSMAVTFLAWVVSTRSIEGRLRDQFALRTEQVAQTVTRRMLEHTAILRGAVALFLASEQVSRAEFAQYFQHLELERHYPGILGIGFAKLVPRGKLAAVEAEVQGEGFPTFRVLPEGARDVYTPIVYLEPFRGRNLRAFGFDMYSEAHRRAAMDRAWQTGRPAASAIVTLVQETSHDVQHGFLLYLPVFRPEARTPAERRLQLAGFVYSPLRTGDLMAGILGSGPNDIDYALYDAESRTPFLDTRPAAAARSETELSRERVLDVGGRSWTMRFWTRPSFGRWLDRHQPLYVLLGGVVINLLLLYIVSSGAWLQRRAQRLAHDMTQELKRSHAREQAHMLSSLQEKETLLKEIHHRVKNNLQVVSSLLSLQRSHTQDERAMEPLRQSQGRVLAMAALHEFLYQAHDLSRVDARAYLTHLVAILAETYQTEGRVAITLELEDVPLDVDRAIPCGLITNELVSNAFKYALPERGAGQLKVRLQLKDGLIVLEVADDGPGLPDTVDMEAPSTLGLQLVRLLTDQLGGRVQIDAQRGTEVRITFAAESVRGAR